MIIAANGAFCQQLTLKSNISTTIKPGFISPQTFFYQPTTVPVLPGNFYCTQLGFFCKKELRLEAITKIPFKFRLGSLQYNDWLEGKRNAGVLPLP